MESNSDTRIERQDSTHLAYSYKSRDGEFSVGNGQILILRDKKGDVKIDGFVEVGSIDKIPAKRMKVTAANDIERFFPSAITPPSIETSHAIYELRTKLERDSKLRPFFNNPRTDKAAATKAVMSSMKELGRAVSCRLVMIWGLPNTIEPEIHYLVLDNTDDTAIAVDILAGRRPLFGLPFYGTEEAWAKKFRDAYPRSFIAYKDFDSVADIDSAFSGAISHTSKTVGLMTPLRVPEWRLRAVDCPMYSYNPQDTTTFSTTIHLADKGHVKPKEVDLDPQWSVNVDTKGLFFGVKEDIFKGVYEKPAGSKQKDYYIRSDGRTYQVILDNAGTGWELKLDQAVKNNVGTIAVKRKEDGRWIVNEKVSKPEPLPEPVNGNLYPSAPVFNKLADDLLNIDVDRVMWNDNYDKRIVDRNAAQMRIEIDRDVNEMGGLETYEELTGINPYAPTEPAGALSANNLFKLMVEDRFVVDPTKMQQIDYSKFATVVKDLDHTKNYVFLIKDHRLGHQYLIDFPAGPEMKAYILQSNLGGGVLPELRIRDWLRNRSMESVNVEDILALMRPDFVQLPPGKQRSMLASIFDAQGKPENIELAHLREDKGVTFVMRRYDRANFERNVERVLGAKDGGS